MTHPSDLPPFSHLQFYPTSTYGCSYLLGRIARSQVVSPAHLIDSKTYGELVRSGFRRSGIFTYRPYCDVCHACIPLRILAQQFVPNRSQRRALQLHNKLTVRDSPLRFHEDHYRLYQRYQDRRHQGGGMDSDSRDQYAHFLLQSQVTTKLLEFYDAGELRMVSITDYLEDGLSSVYTFYDPDLRGKSLGTYAILWQIAECTRQGLDYVYLGYWIADSQKMSYKSNYQPHEIYEQGVWQLHHRPRLSHTERHSETPPLETHTPREEK